MVYSDTAIDEWEEPMGAFIERLWAADVASSRSRRLAEWVDRVQGSAPVTAERHIDGWTKDGKAVTIVGVVYGGEEMPTDARKIGTKRVIVKDVPRTRPRYGK